jgi:hypothetical protein
MSPSSFSSSLLLSSSFGTAAIGQIMVDVLSGHSIIPPQEKKKRKEGRKKKINEELPIF